MRRDTGGRGRVYIHVHCTIYDVGIVILLLLSLSSACTSRADLSKDTGSQYPKM